MSKIWCLLIPGFNPVLLQMANKIPFFPISHSYEGFSYKLVKISFSLGLLSISTEVERRPPPSQSLPRLSWSPCFSPVLNAFYMCTEFQSAQHIIVLYRFIYGFFSPTGLQTSENKDYNLYLLFVPCSTQQRVPIQTNMQVILTWLRITHHSFQSSKSLKTYSPNRVRVLI